MRDANSHIESNESDEFIQHISAAVAQYDNRQKSKRVRENMRRHGTDGYHMHKAPYGLRNARSISGKPIIKIADSEVIKKISYLLNEFSKGIFNKGELVQEARKIGLTQPNGKLMSYQLMAKILEQPIYGGLDKSVFTDGQLIQSKSFGGIVPDWVYSFPRLKPWYWSALRLTLS